MKLSTNTDVGERTVGIEKTLEYIAKAGFDAWDFSMFSMITYDWGTKKIGKSSHVLAGNGYLEFARRLKKIGEDNGIHCNQSHAPFPSLVPDIMPYLKRALECTAEAGGNICIIHPDNNKSAEENAEMFFELLPFAKECGVKIATENMYNWNKEKNEACFAACSNPKDFNAHLDAVNDEYLVACLDLGHAEMRGLNTSAAEMVTALGKRLKALHIHDVDKWHDNHQIPFSLNIDYAPIVKALKEINYDGYFTLEADNFLAEYNESNIFEGFKKLYEADKKLADMFENE